MAVVFLTFHKFSKYDDDDNNQMLESKPYTQIASVDDDAVTVCLSQCIVHTQCRSQHKNAKIEEPPLLMIYLYYKRKISYFHRPRA